MIVMINTVSTAQRVAMWGSSFKISNEITTAIVGGVATKLVVVLMAALGPCFESLNGEDVTAIFKLYEA